MARPVEVKRRPETQTVKDETDAFLAEVDAQLEEAREAQGQVGNSATD